MQRAAIHLAEHLHEVPVHLFVAGWRIGIVELIYINVAASLDEFRQDALAMLCAAGLAGLPQLSVPAGSVDNGPVGLGLVGARGADLPLIRLAEAAGIGKTV